MRSVWAWLRAGGWEYVALAVLAVVFFVLVGGCGYSEPDDLADGRVAVERANVDPVAVLDESKEWQAGVHDHPLRPGESLAFVFPRPWAGGWTMEGVDYPLVLIALDQDGSHLGRVRMAACPPRAAVHLCSYESPAAAAAFLEVRPLRR